METKKKIYYWAPFIDNVATIKAVYNSVKSLNKYSNNFYEGVIVDVFGEWKNKNYFQLKNINFFELNNIPFLLNFSSKGFLSSRLKYILIFLFSFFPLKKFIFKHKPEYLIVHLVTSLPIFINFFFKFKTKIILRISGKPKLNLMRYIFWKIFLKKVYKITFPTKETLTHFQSLNIVSSEKLELLYDPILEVRKINKKFKDENLSEFNNKKFFLAIGRLTKQKNFIFLIKCFKEIIKSNNNINLLIIGSGEDYKKLNNFIIKNELQKNIFLMGYKENVFKYLKICEAFILSSLWEDPGFVIVEAMYSNRIVISSDCPSGPKEIVGDKNGIMFKNNSIKDFINKFNIYTKLSTQEKKKIILNSKKSLKKFTLFSHYKKLKNILD